jgi:hypothetical protein
MGAEHTCVTERKPGGGASTKRKASAGVITKKRQGDGCLRVTGPGICRAVDNQGDAIATRIQQRKREELAKVPAAPEAMRALSPARNPTLCRHVSRFLPLAVMRRWCKSGMNTWCLPLFSAVIAQVETIHNRMYFFRLKINCILAAMLVPFFLKSCTYKMCIQDLREIHTV